MEQQNKGYPLGGAPAFPQRCSDGTARVELYHRVASAMQVGRDNAHVLHVPDGGGQTARSPPYTCPRGSRVPIVAARLGNHRLYWGACRHSWRLRMGDLREMRLPAQTSRLSRGSLIHLYACMGTPTPELRPGGARTEGVLVIRATWPPSHARAIVTFHPKSHRTPNACA